MECSKEWLTVQDVATILDVDRRGVEKLINKKHLRAKNVSTTDIRKTWRNYGTNTVVGQRPYRVLA